METGKATEKRGGARAGAGRPKGIKIPYKTISMRLPEEYVDMLHIAAEKSGLSIKARSGGKTFAAGLPLSPIKWKN